MDALGPKEGEVLNKEGTEEWGARNEERVEAKRSNLLNRNQGGVGKKSKDIKSNNNSRFRYFFLAG